MRDVLVRKPSILRTHRTVSLACHQRAPPGSRRAPSGPTAAYLHCTVQYLPNCPPASQPAYCSAGLPARLPPIPVRWPPDSTLAALFLCRLLFVDELTIQHRPATTIFGTQHLDYQARVSIVHPHIVCMLLLYQRQLFIPLPCWSMPRL